MIALKLKVSHLFTSKSISIAVLKTSFKALDINYFSKKIITKLNKSFRYILWFQ